MEKLNAGIEKSTWCEVGVIFCVGAAVVTGGAAAPLAIAGAAAFGLSC